MSLSSILCTASLRSMQLFTFSFCSSGNILQFIKWIMELFQLFDTAIVRDIGSYKYLYMSHWIMVFNNALARKENVKYPKPQRLPQNNISVLGTYHTCQTWMTLITFDLCAWHDQDNSPAVSGWSPSRRRSPCWVWRPGLERLARCIGSPSEGLSAPRTRPLWAGTSRWSYPEQKSQTPSASHGTWAPGDMQDMSWHVIKF